MTEVQARFHNQWTKACDIVSYTNYGLISFIVVLPVLSSYVSGVQGLYSEDAVPTTLSVLRSLAFMLVVFAAIPAWHLINTLKAPWTGTKELVGLRRVEGDLLLGVAVGVILLCSSIVISILGQGFGVIKVGVVDSAGTAAVWALLLYAVLGSVAEEFFFRGVLQERVTWIGQAILFGVAHFSLGAPYLIIVPLLAGFALGWLRHKTGSLVPGIVAHVTFNVTQVIVREVF